MNYEKYFEETINKIKNEGRYRVFIDILRNVQNFPSATKYNDKNEASDQVTVWCSNDYLGMGQNTNVINAMKKALDTCGAGSGGTRNISGTTHYHVLLEKELADLHNKESALLFTSGYISNEATLSTLASTLPNCYVFSDELNHSSMIQGIRASGANKIIFKHNDVKDLQNKIKELDKDIPKIIAFESVYSMDGDIAPISEISAIAKENNALTYLDSSVSSFVSFLDSLCFSILSTNFLPSFVLPSNKFFFFFFFFLTTTTELSSPVPATDGPVAFAGASSPIGRPVYGFTSSNLLTIKFLLMHLL